MRPLLLSLAAVVALLAAGVPDSHAQTPYDYPICAYYNNRSGASACYYSSYEQCRATMSGIGGSCSPNPFYRGPAAAAGFDGGGVVAAPPRRKVRRHRS